MLSALNERRNRRWIVTLENWARPILIATVAAGPSGLALDANAQQSFPAKPIRIVVTNSPGGTSDFFARVLGRSITDATQQPVLVDNRPGGSGMIAAETVAQAAPDGYTLFLGGATALTVTPILFPKVTYDPMKDFAPITQIALFPSLMVAHPSLPVRNVKDLIALAKARPGELSYASTGAGQTSHLGMELLKTMANVNIYHVPYKASVAALVDLIGGRLSVMLATFPAGLPHIKSGKLRALAVTALKRSAALPELPTVAESGLPGYEITLWHGMYSAAGTPDAVVAKLNALVVEALKAPEIKTKLVHLGAEPLGTSPQRVTEQMKVDIVKWRKVIHDSGAKPE